VSYRGALGVPVHMHSRTLGYTTAAMCPGVIPRPASALTAAIASRDADLVAGVPPSDNDRLEAIRAYADRAMRYYATAFLRETDENRELMQAYMGINASILALLDRDALDDRSMMSGREEIIQQYVEQARSDPYEPGNCSFCGERPVAAWFEGPSFAARLKCALRRRGWPAGYALVLSKRMTARGWSCEASTDCVGGIETRGGGGVRGRRLGCSK
jgi:hypothetical protein